MGLFSFAKKQLLSVIEWNDDSKDTLVYRFQLQKREEIMNSSTLVVRPSQIAVFVHKGQIADIFAPGTYKLATENIPFLTKILSLPTGFDSPIKAEVYFINTKQMTGQKWGTQNPIMMRDSEFGNIRLRAFGVYSFKVKNARTFMEQMFGTNSFYTAGDVAQHLKPSILQSMTDVVAATNVSALDLAAKYKEISSEVKKQASADFEKFGLELCNVVIENISLPEDVEKVLDERTKLGVMEDKMGTFTQYQAAQAMRDAAQNESGNNMAGLGVGLSAGVGMGEVFTEALKNAKNTPKKTQLKSCQSCGAEMKNSAKFCPECGEKQETVKKTKHCTECGAEVKTNAKFCPECGAKF